MGTTSSGTQSNLRASLQPQHCRRSPKDPSGNLHWDFCPVVTGRAQGFMLWWTRTRSPSARHLAMGRVLSATMLPVSPWGRLGKPSLKDLQGHVRGKGEKEGEGKPDPR